MSRRISFFFHIIVVFLLFCSNTKSSELKIIPLKKPILTKEVIEKKISKNIIKPKKKPIKTLDKAEIKEDEKLKPKKKPSEQKEEAETKIAEKTIEVEIKENKIKLILPKNKPLVVKKEKVKAKKTSKFYKKKRF